MEVTGARRDAAYGRRTRAEQMLVLRQDFVGEIKVAVSEDVDFDAGEDGDAFDLLGGGANARDVFDGALVIEAVGEGKIL